MDTIGNIHTGLCFMFTDDITWDLIDDTSLIISYLLYFMPKQIMAQCKTMLGCQVREIQVQHLCEV